MHEKLASMSIHERIRTLRVAKGWSQEDLAKHVSEAEGLKKQLAWQTVQQWENGRSAPARKRLGYVADLFGVTPAYLMDGGEPGNTPTATTTSPTSGWPFRTVKLAQLVELPEIALVQIEQIIGTFVGTQVVPVDFRAKALKVAAELDLLHRSDTFTTFVRAVDTELEKDARMQRLASSAARLTTGEPK